MSELVEAGLRLILEEKASEGKLEKLPSWNSGGARVDLANRDHLYTVMERD